MSKYTYPNEFWFRKSLGRLCVSGILSGFVFVLWLLDPDVDDILLNFIIWLIPMFLGFFLLFSVNDLVMYKLKLYDKIDVTRIN
jgi:hypothetical protein